MIVYILNFLILCVSLVLEDLIWLRDYIQTVSAGEFTLFLLGVIVYTLLFRNLSVIMDWLLSNVSSSNIIVPLLRSQKIKRLRKKSDEYCRGYSDGYCKGYGEGKHERNWRWWNPFSWF